MKIRFLAILSILSLLISSGTTVSKADMYADEYFANATVSLSTNKTISVYLVTKKDPDYIQINSCWLEQKTGSTWSSPIITNLPLPTTYSIVGRVYSATANYSSFIGAGTYRIGLEVETNGYTKTIYSNARTYSS